MLTHVRNTAAELGRSMLDFVFPRCCPVCDAVIRMDAPVCHACTEQLMETAGAFEAPVRSIPSVDLLSVLLPYSESCRSVIHALKYHGNPAVGNWLGGLMAANFLRNCSIPDSAVVAPVPLHPKRLRQRGYNQSERIADGFASYSGFRIDTALLERACATPTQTKLGEEERRANVRNVFRYIGNRPLDGLPVILVDDVLTTGSTISECARTLKEHGAGNITVCVAATPRVGED